MGYPVDRTRGRDYSNDMDEEIKARMFTEGGKIAGQIIRMAFNRPRRSVTEEAEITITSTPQELSTSEAQETSLTQPIQTQTKPAIALPTAEETTAELKRRLGRELYKAELDLAGGLLIAGKPCDCLDNKHTLLLEAAAEELVSQDPGNTVYLEIIQWIKDNQQKVTIEAIESGQYRKEYQTMALKFKEFRKRVMGTAAFSAMGNPPQEITLEEAKRLASEEAAKEVERQWQEKGVH